MQQHLSPKRELVPHAHKIAAWGLSVVLTSSLVPAPAFALSSAVAAGPAAPAPAAPTALTSATSPTYEIADAALLVNGAQKPDAQVGDTLSVRAWEEDEDTFDEYDIPAENLSYTWQVSADKNQWSAISGAQASTQELVLGDEFAGKYVRCVVKSGAYAAVTNPSSKVAPGTSVGGDTGSETGAGTGADSGAGTGTGTGSGSGSNTGSNTGSSTDPAEQPQNLVTLSSATFETSGVAAEAGATLTATAKVKGSWFEKDVPADATVSYIWQTGPAADGPWTALPEEDVTKQGQVLLVPERLAGSFVRVVAKSQNEVTSKAAQVLPAQTYALDRVSVSGMSGAQGTPVVGDTLSAAAFAKTLFGASTTSVKGRAGVTYRWFAAPSASASASELEPLEAADGATLKLTSSLVGKYLQVEAVSGDSVVRAQLSAPVLDPNSLEGIAQRLDASGFKLAPMWGQDSNANSYLEHWLQTKLGVNDVAVQLVSAQLGGGATSAGADADCAGGVSSELATNGAITYFWSDPQTANPTSWSTRRQLKVTYRLTRKTADSATSAASATTDATTDKNQSSETYLYTPARQGNLPWDHTKVAAWLAKQADTLELPLAQGDTPESLTSAFTAPYQLKLATGSSSWAPKVIVALSWTSSHEDSLSVKQPDSWSDFTLTPRAAAQDQSVTLTVQLSAARVDSSDSTLAQVTTSKPFSVKLPANPALIDQQKAELQSALDQALSYQALVGADTGEQLDPSALTQDIQLLRARGLGLDAHDVAVSYLSDSPALEISGYRARVFQGKPGTQAQVAHLTLTLTSKTNPQVSASKTLTYTVPALTRDELVAEKNLLLQAKNNFWRAISERSGQITTPDAVTQNLSPFYKLYADASAPDGIAIAYSSAAASQGSAAGSGIVPVDLQSFDPMGPATQARRFASSAPEVIANETLKLTRPTYDTKVTVSAELSSERYARYAERYPDDPQFSGLSAQRAEASFTVSGLEGPKPNEDSNTTKPDPKTITVYAQVFGPAEQSSSDTSGTAGTPWTERMSFEVPATATAADLSAQLFSAAGLTICAQGTGAAWYLESVVSPKDSQTLGWNEQTGQYWQLFINGKSSEVMAGAYTLVEGDVVSWYYSRYGDTLPTTPSDNPSENPSDNPAPDKNEGSQDTNHTEGGSTSSDGGAIGLDELEGTGQFHAQAGAIEAPTPTQTASASWKTQVGGSGQPVSEPVVVGSKVLAVSGRTLKLLDSGTGAVRASFELDGSISYTSRPAVASGVAYVALEGGAVEAVDLTHMQKLWTSAATSVQDQASCTVSLVELAGKPAVLVGTSAFNSSFAATEGSFVALDAATGTQIFNARNMQSGYYWTGAAPVRDWLLIGDQAGILHAFDAQGSQTSILNLESPISGDVVAYGSNQALVVTRDGVLHKVSVDAHGKMSEQTLKVLKGSTSAISVSGTLGVVTGEGDAAGSSAFALVDLATFTLTRVIDATPEGKLPAAAAGTYGGGSKAPALIARANGQTYVYITLNVAQNPSSDYTSYASGGNVYVYRVGDTTAQLLYAPAAGVDANYCDSPVVADAAGNLYYLNDSGYLVRLTSATSDQPTSDHPTFDQPTSDQPDNQNNNSDTGQSNNQSHNHSHNDVASDAHTDSKTESDANGAKGARGAGSGASADSETDSKTESNAQPQPRDSEKTQAQASVSSQRSRAIPWWPFAGIAVGIAGLWFALFGGTKRKNNSNSTPTNAEA